MTCTSTKQTAESPPNTGGWVLRRKHYSHVRRQLSPQGGGFFSFEKRWHEQLFPKKKDQWCGRAGLIVSSYKWKDKKKISINKYLYPTVSWWLRWRHRSLDSSPGSTTTWPWALLPFLFFFFFKPEWSWRNCFPSVTKILGKDCVQSVSQSVCHHSGSLTPDITSLIFHPSDITNQLEPWWHQ